MIPSQKNLSFLPCYSLLLIFIVAYLCSCETQANFEYPVVFTGEVTDIDSSGATFHGKISDINLEDIQSYGFEWNNEDNPTNRIFEVYELTGPPTDLVFSKRVSTTLIKDINYVVRAFAKNSQATIYGKEITFISTGSLGPEITDFSPKTGNLSDTIMIYGKGFSADPLNNVVSFNHHRAWVESASSDSLQVVVPDRIYTAEAEITVSIVGNASRAPEPFQLIVPEILDFQPKRGNVGSEVILRGTNFQENPRSIRVYFGELFTSVHADILEINGNEVKVKVPGDLKEPENRLRLIMNNQEAKSADSFVLLSTELTDFHPKIIKSGETLTITGKNFSILPGNTQVKLGDDIDLPINSISETSISCTLPLQDQQIYPDRELSLAISVFGEEYSFSEKLLIDDDIFRLQDIPFQHDSLSHYGILDAAYATVGQKAYVLLAYSRMFFEYNPFNDTWKRLADFPGTKRIHAVSYGLDNKVFLGTGQKNFSRKLGDWWMYVPSTDSWFRLQDFPGGARTAATGFSLGNHGYLGTGEGLGWNYRDMWKHNPNQDTWTQISDIPFVRDTFPRSASHLTSIAGPTLAYVGVGSIPAIGDQNSWVFTFDPNTEVWTRIKNFPFYSRSNLGSAFFIGGKPYFRTVQSRNFFSYNAAIDEWEKLETHTTPNVSRGISFVSGGKVYLSSGRSIWEYDPNR